MKAIVSSAILVAVVCGITENAMAQVVPDNTLGTQVTQSGAVLGINNGTRSGNNLFHSFSQFSIPTGGSAVFNNALDVQNIFSRVTGSQFSNIDGILKSQGTANLFLMNPNGVVFGPNAQLQLGGSFLGTTATGIKFADALEFNVMNTTPVLLSVNLPIGLQMGTNSGAIQVQGAGHKLAVIVTPTQAFPPFTRETNPAGLTVQPGKTLALVGGGISIAGGQLRADQGRVELGSVSAGSVKLTPIASGFALSYEDIPSFQDIQLTQKALLDASESVGNDGIHLSGRLIKLSGGSAGLVQNTLSSSPGGQIVVKASERVEITDTTDDKRFRSNLTTETTAAGTSGDIKISTKELVFREGGQIVSRTFTAGDAGNILVNASDSIQVLGISTINPRFQSSIFANSGGSATGKAGNITLSTQKLIATGGAIISNASFSKGGAGGALVVNADLVDISGVDPIFKGPTDLRFGSFSGGDGGSLTLNARRVIVRDGARMNGTTIGKGNAANLTINASESVDINAGIVTSSASFPDFRTILVGYDSDPTGKAGTIAINTGRLTVRNNGKVTVQNSGPANAGKLQIRADVVELDRGGTLSASTKLGEGGNIQLDIRNLL